MTSESFCALCDLAAQLEWSRQITKVRRKGGEECGWMEMTGCGILFESDIEALQAVIKKREYEDRKRLDAAATKFVRTFLANDLYKFDEVN